VVYNKTITEFGFCVIRVVVSCYIVWVRVEFSHLSNDQLIIHYEFYSDPALVTRLVNFCFAMSQGVVNINNTCCNCIQSLWL
jgi:hypothetical protein